jgi:YgiT-type zinc finger domain-containing protein
MSAPKLKSCPVCSGRKLRTVRQGSHTTHRNGRAITVRHIDFQQCENCGEKFFDDATMGRIEQARDNPRRKAVG